MRIESSGKPDAWKLARPVWGWGRGAIPRPTPLSTMFWITTATAIVCAMTFSMPEMVAVPLFVLFSVVLTAVLITIIIHGGSYERTFCIGAVVPFGVLLVSLAFGGVVFIDGPSRLNFLAFRLAVVGSWV